VSPRIFMFDNGEMNEGLFKAIVWDHIYAECKVLCRPYQAGGVNRGEAVLGVKLLVFPTGAMGIIYTSQDQSSDFPTPTHDILPLHD
jgi:hypothetical protein